MATRPPGQAPQVLRALAKFAGIFALLWFGLYEFQRAFPYFQTGADVVFQVKERWELTPHLFKKLDAARVLFFGNSKVLSGIVPDQFDAALEASGRSTESYNLGLPAYNYFVDRLAAILAAGNIPSYIIITVPWASDPPRANLFHFVRHDSQVADELFPFRPVARDMIMAAISSRQPEGIINYYEANRAIVERMIADRGYFFVYDTSHFPNDQLPANFRTPLDDATRINQRQVGTREGEFHKLDRLLETYQVRCLMVPQYFRVGQFAEAPPENQQLRAELAPYQRIKLLGPDYIRLDNRYFSDASHLNREGARLYTRYIADLVAPSLR